VNSVAEIERVIGELRYIKGLNILLLQIFLTRAVRLESGVTSGYEVCRELKCLFLLNPS
jgi:hypothetical protein